MKNLKNIKNQLKERGIIASVDSRCFRSKKYYVLKVKNVNTKTIAEQLNINSKYVYEIYTDMDNKRIIWIDKEKLHENNIIDCDGEICFPDKWSIYRSNGCLRPLHEIAKRLELKGRGSDINITEESNNITTVLLIFGCNGGRAGIASALKISEDAIIDVSCSHLQENNTLQGMTMMIIVNNIKPAYPRVYTSP